MNQINATPAVSSIGAGLIASLCCGGALVFGSIGLGALYGALGLSRYIPQALAAGALSIAAINYLFYRRAAERAHRAGAGNILALRQAMFSSSALGVAAMAVSFVFLEWLNHAIVNPHFLSRPEYGQALIPGVPGVRLLYALASFWTLALLWALPWPRFNPIGQERPVALQRGLRAGVYAGTAGVLVVLIVNAVSGGSGHGRGRNTGTAQHGSASHRSQ
jgi:hypothetical protein